MRLPEWWQGIACIQSGSLLSYGVGANYGGDWPLRLRRSIGQEPWRKYYNPIQRFLCILFGFWAELRASKKESNNCCPERKMGCRRGTGETGKMGHLKSIWIGLAVFYTLERYIVIYFTSEEPRKKITYTFTGIKKTKHIYLYFLG